jgi:hypothetical protein
LYLIQVVNKLEVVEHMKISALERFKVSYKFEVCGIDFKYIFCYRIVGSVTDV